MERTAGKDRIDRIGWAEQDGQDRIDRVDRTGRTGQNLHGMADWIDRKDGTVGKMLKGT